MKAVSALRSRRGWRRRRWGGAATASVAASLRERGTTDSERDGEDKRRRGELHDFR